LKIQHYLSLIKFSHTIFALPFAMIGYVLGTDAYHDGFSLQKFGCVLGCMVFARSAAMAFNRYLDRDIDAINPRTAVREIPAGQISPKAALAFVLVCCLVFILTTYFINNLCFALSPIALLVTLGYSYTKRFTYLCHFVLGLGLALAPIGAYMATTGRFDILPLIYSFIVLFWVAGFDIIYALQDENFDRTNHLNSIPVQLGRVGALRLSNALHALCTILMLIATTMLWQKGVPFHWLQALGALIFIGLLFYQHSLVKKDDLSKVDMAFFTTNGIASVLYGTCFILDFLI
jgi:4-hydroxybenzoate polyprenyltransferase